MSEAHTTFPMSCMIHIVYIYQTERKPAGEPALLLGMSIRKYQVPIGFYIISSCFAVNQVTTLTIGTWYIQQQRWAMDVDWGDGSKTLYDWNRMG